MNLRARRCSLGPKALPRPGPNGLAGSGLKALLQTGLEGFRGSGLKALLQLGIKALLLVAVVGQAADPEQTLRRSGIGDVSTLDPHLWIDGWEGNIVQDLFQGLTELDGAVNVVPGIAESWNVGADGRTYEFVLRKDARWSDGVPITSADVVYSFQRIMDPATASPMASLLFLIENAREVNTGQTAVEDLGVRALDEHRVEVTLVEPAPYFTELIVHRGKLAPRHVIEKHGRGWARPGTMVTNGAYLLDEWVPQGHVRLVKNPTFHDADQVRLEVMYHIPMEDLATGLKQYRADEIDILTVIPPSRLDWARENLPDEVRFNPILGLDYYVFNTEKAPFNDERIRLALSMAVNREVITERITRGGEIPAYGIVPPGVLNYPESAEPTFKRQPHPERVQQARRLLAEAGFGPGNPLEFTLRYNTNEQHKRVAVAAVAMWKPLGVRVSLLNSEQRVLVADIRSGDFEVARASWFAEVRDPMTYLELLHSQSGPINRSRYSNAEYDQLVDSARRSTDLAQRAALMLQAEQMALEAQAILPINFYVGKRLVKPYVEGWTDNPRGIHLARYLSVVPSR